MYHLDKANVVANTLSRVSMGSMAHVESGNKEIVKEFHHFAYLGVRLNSLSDGGILVPNGMESSFSEEIKAKRDMDPA